MLMKVDAAAARSDAAVGGLVVSEVFGRVVVAGVVAATATLSLSALFRVQWLGLNPLFSQTEFFAYSWIYGIRWGAGEQVFQPHSQLLFPIFALINWTLNLSRGSPRAIMDGWAAVSFWWHVFLMTGSLAILYGSMGRKGILLNAAFSSVVFVTAVPLYFDDSVLFSTSYHLLAVPLALFGLFFWQRYSSDPARRMPVGFFVLLGIYAAICALGKPTFVAFAAPLFAMEAVKIRSIAALGAVEILFAIGKIALAAAVALIAYVTAIVAFYHHGFDGLLLHFASSKLFMTSQFHWYDAAKGATPIHWYLSYVIGVMGWLPTILLALSLALASISPQRAILLAGVGAGFFLALFFLYFRSQLFGHPEFIAAAATTTIGAFRCSSLPIAMERRLESRRLTPLFQLGVGVLTASLFLHLFPLDRGHDFMIAIGQYEKPIDDVLFQRRPGLRTVVMMVYPNILNGSADAWCRGGSNIFDNVRSDSVDGMFPDIVCADRAQASNRDYKRFNNALFLRKGASTDEAIASLGVTFPTLIRRLEKCHETGGELPDHSRLIECRLNPVD